MANSVIVGLGDAQLFVERKTQQPFFVNCCQDHLINCRVNPVVLACWPC